MIMRTFRTLVLPALLLLATSAAAQVSNRINPAGNRINPAGNRIIVPPSPTTVITPGFPITPYSPGISPYPLGAVITTPPTVIVPSYPSAWIGPTVIRETHGEPAPTSASTNATSPNPAAALRLVAIVGMLTRFDPATGEDRGVGESPLSVAVGVLTGYSPSASVMASGDFFGASWDGRAYFGGADEDERRGPFLGHPVMTLNEFRPSPWEFEAGAVGRRVAWMRLAVTLFEDHALNPGGKSVNLPRGRRPAMREVLHRITWTDKGVAAKSPGITESDALAGGDVTHFGKALAIFAEKTMTPVPDNERIGIAEWHFTAKEMAALLAACPRYPEVPDSRELREARASAGDSIPPWTRPFGFRDHAGLYGGELWFVIVPDAAVAQWLQRK